MLGVDERGHAAEFLGAGDDVQGQRGLAGTLRPEELADSPARDAASAQGQVQAQAPVGMPGTETIWSSASFMMLPVP